MANNLIGGYEIIREIGSGGMAKVFLAKNNEGAKVAVKVLRDEYAQRPDIRRRFTKEAEAMVKLQGHPNIVSLIDTSQGNIILMLIMEYLEGNNLNVYVKEKGPIEDIFLLKKWTGTIIRI